MHVAWGFGLGRMPEHEVFFRVESLRPAMKGTSCARRAVRLFWCVIGSLMVFCNAWFVVCA